MKKRIFIIVIAALLISLLTLPAYAALTRTVTVELVGTGGTRLGDFTVRLWRVADADFQPGAAFLTAVDWDAVDIENVLENSVANRETAALLLTRATAGTGIAPLETRISGADGIIRFINMEGGVYLVTAVDNRNPARFIFTPFVFWVSNEGEFDLTAAPKGSAPDEPPPRDPPPRRPPPPRVPPPPPPADPPPDDYVVEDPELPYDDYDPPEEYEVPEEEVPLDEYPPGDLPQTGALRWPIPILAGTGGIMLTTGAILNRKRD